MSRKISFNRGIVSLILSHRLTYCSNSQPSIDILTSLASLTTFCSFQFSKSCSQTLSSIDLLSSFHWAKTLLSLINTRLFSLNELPFETDQNLYKMSRLTTRYLLQTNVCYCVVERPLEFLGDFIEVSHCVLMLTYTEHVREYE